MSVEILNGRRVQLTDGTISYGEADIVEALVNHLSSSSPLATLDQVYADTEEIVGQLFDAMEEKNVEERYEEALEDERVTNADLSAQIDKLAHFILREVPGEPSENEGAVDTAIRIIQKLQSQVEAKDILIGVLKTELNARTEALQRIDRSLVQLLEVNGVLAAPALTWSLLITLAPKDEPPP